MCIVDALRVDVVGHQLLVVACVIAFAHKSDYDWDRHFLLRDWKTWIYDEGFKDPDFESIEVGFQIAQRALGAKKALKSNTNTVGSSKGFGLRNRSVRILMTKHKQTPAENHNSRQKQEAPPRTPLRMETRNNRKHQPSQQDARVLASASSNNADSQAS